MAEIRAVEGFESFLAAPPFGEIADLAVESALVYLVAAASGGAVLGVTPDKTVVCNLLPDLTEEAVLAHTDAYMTAYDRYRASPHDRNAAVRWRRGASRAPEPVA